NNLLSSSNSSSLTIFCDGIIPSSAAMTRSKMHLFISYCNNRSKFGKKFDCFPSRFIDEIPEEDIQNYDKTVDITITTDEITSIKNMLINKKGSS
ncbi:MAG TPA: hypothetical protein PLN45_06710, partial [Exilispira sp.]|nr:hypothetical protein [Exilispira sp.]